MRHGKGHRLKNGRMIHEHGIDFVRCDLFSSTVDEFFNSAGKEEIRLAVEIAQISSSEPSPVKRRRVILRSVAITIHNTRTTDDYLTDHARREKVASFIYNRQLGSGGYTDRPALSLSGRQRIARYLMGCLGHAIRFNHWSAKSLFQFRYHPRW